MLENWEDLGGVIYLTMLPTHPWSPTTLHQPYLSYTITPKVGLSGAQVGCVLGKPLCLEELALTLGGCSSRARQRRRSGSLRLSKLTCASPLLPASSRGGLEWVAHMAPCGILALSFLSSSSCYYFVLNDHSYLSPLEEQGRH